MRLSLFFREQFSGPLSIVGEELDQLVAALNSYLSLTGAGLNLTSLSDPLRVHDLKFLGSGTITGALRLNDTLQLLKGPWFLDQPGQDVAVIDPPDLAAGTYNDYSPPGLGTALGVDFTPTGAVVITGIVATHGRQKRLLFLRNTDATNSVTLNHNDGGSAAANRMILPGAANLTLGPRQNLWLYYDPDLPAWTAFITPNSAILGSLPTHALLSSTAHTDTVTQTVTRGSLIAGNSTPAWDELVIGSNNRVLRSNGTDPSWAQVVLTTDVSGVLPVANGGTNVSSTTQTYTPTRSAESNLDSNVTTTEAQYLRVGNTVVVAGRFTADPTAPGAASFEMSLPVTSDIGAAEDVAGTAFCGAIAGQGAAITGSVANNTAVVSWIAGDVTSQTWSYQFVYQVI